MWGGNKRNPSRGVAARRKFSLKIFAFAASAAALGSLALIAGLFVAADVASQASAVNMTGEVTAVIDNTYTVTISAPDVTLGASTASTGDRTAYSQGNIDVSTDAPGGVELYINMDGDTNALFLGGDSSATSSIASTTATSSDPLTLDGLASNTWGYSVDNTNYQAVPTSTTGAVLISSIDEGTNGQTSASVPIYYGMKVNDELVAGSYSNKVTYSAVVNGTTSATASLTSITVDGAPVEQLQAGATNTITATIGLMTASFGTPRVYLTTTDPAGTIECQNVVTGANNNNYLQVVCDVTPDQAATDVTMTITGKGSSDDIFCQGGTYETASSECQAGDWRWGTYTVAMPNVAANGPTTFEEAIYM